MLIAIIIIVCVTGWILFTALRKPPNFPPGPPGLFSFYTMYKSADSFFAKTIIQLSSKYGPIVGLRLLNRHFLCVSGYEAVTEALNNPALDSRPNSFDFNCRTSGLRRGVTFTDGELWKEQRRFTVRHLRDFGMGKSSQEDFIIDEVNDLISSLEESRMRASDGNILLKDTFTLSILNITWSMISGKRFGRKDPKLEILSNCITGFMHRTGGGPSRLAFFHVFRRLFPELTGYTALMKFVQPIRNYIQEEVVLHRKTKEVGEPRDFIDAYLQVLYNENQSTDGSYYSEEQLIGICFDFFVAGVTTTHALSFALLLMIKYPQVQSKVQIEIDEILSSGLPKLIDRSRLPYTEATLLEIQRFVTVVPLTIPHVAEQDTMVGGYHIPKGTLAFINVMSVHMDPEYWVDPDQFRPERHLNSKGQLIKSDHIMNFGIGNRSCTGENLARNSLFLFFTTLMQRFRFLPPTGLSDPTLEPSLDPIPGLTLQARPCLAHLINRNL